MAVLRTCLHFKKSELSACAARSFNIKSQKVKSEKVAGNVGPRSGLRVYQHSGPSLLAVC